MCVCVCVRARAHVTVFVYLCVRVCMCLCGAVVVVAIVIIGVGVGVGVALDAIVSSPSSFMWCVISGDCTCNRPTHVSWFSCATPKTMSATKNCAQHTLGCWGTMRQAIRTVPSQRTPPCTANKLQASGGFSILQTQMRVCEHAHCVDENVENVAPARSFFVFCWLWCCGHMFLRCYQRVRSLAACVRVASLSRCICFLALSTFCTHLQTTFFFRSTFSDITDSTAHKPVKAFERGTSIDQFAVLVASFTMFASAAECTVTAVTSTVDTVAFDKPELDKKCEWNETSWPADANVLLHDPIPVWPGEHTATDDDCWTTNTLLSPAAEGTEYTHRFPLVLDETSAHAPATVPTIMAPTSLTEDEYENRGMECVSSSSSCYSSSSSSSWV